MDQSPSIQPLPPLQPIPAPTTPSSTPPSTPPPTPSPQAPSAPQKPKFNFRYLIYGIIAVVAIIIVIWLIRHPTYTSIPIHAYPSLLSVYQGSQDSIVANNLQKGDIVVINFAAQNYSFTANSSSESFPLSTNNPGDYIAIVYVSRGGRVVYKSSPFVIQVYPKISYSASYIEPIIYFNSNTAPYAPFFPENSTVNFLIGYLQRPSTLNISRYIVNIATHSLIVNVNASTQGPLNNTITLSRLPPGEYLLKLTIQAYNVSNPVQTYNFSTYQEIFVTNAIPSVSFYAKTNPNTIIVDENAQGGPYSFDPQIDYEAIGGEVIDNIFATLLFYNGSSTTQFIPYLAEYVPTVGHGINSNYTVYNFTLRPGLRFSNGDPLTAYDVWYTVIRALLFVGGSPTTPDWIIAQYLIPNVVPGVPIVPPSNLTLQKQAFNEIMHAVTYNNATDTITFHLIKPTPPTLFFQAVADPLGMGIIDPKQLEEIGYGITFTPQGFAKYEEYANEGNYSAVMQYNPVSSGPYKIGIYVPGQSIFLEVNPYFNGIPGIPKPKDNVTIYWVKDPQTAYYLFASGDADMVDYLPTTYFPQLEQLQSEGKAKIYEFPTLSIIFNGFNIQIANSTMQTLFGNQYKVPSNYFENTLVREAFAYAFNEQEYLNQIIGNEKYGIDFGSNYTNAIAKGLPYYVPPNELTGVPYFNLSYAKKLLIESGEYNVTVNIPAVVPSGDTNDYEAAIMWGNDLHTIDPHISLSPVYLPFVEMIGNMVPGNNPMPITMGIGWAPDYPYPSDYVNALYAPGGAYAASLGWNVTYLNQTDPQEAKQYLNLINLIEEADNAINSTIAAQLYKEVAQAAVNLYMYVYTIQQNGFWITAPYLQPYNNQISHQENPMFGGSSDSLYFWWNKAV